MDEPVDWNARDEERIRADQQKFQQKLRQAQYLLDDLHALFEEEEELGALSHFIWDRIPNIYNFGLF